VRSAYDAVEGAHCRSRKLYPLTRPALESASIFYAQIPAN
jgi:hypothetical protein